MWYSADLLRDYRLTELRTFLATPGTPKLCSDTQEIAELSHLGSRLCILESRVYTKLKTISGYVCLCWSVRNQWVPAIYICWRLQKQEQDEEGENEDKETSDDENLQSDDALSVSTPKFNMSQNMFLDSVPNSPASMSQWYTFCPNLLLEIKIFLS